MATFTLTKIDPYYYILKVTFNGLEFSQEIYSEKTGDELTAEMQAYADAYQSEYVSPVDELPVEEDL
jgi:hypothetical protein